ncbi:WXG100 family type VII secretion target [Saccharothrix isguenensis]
MTAFDIDNNGYLELNEQLLMHVKSVGEILDGLNTVLKGITTATDGKATPLWLDLQTQWSTAYQQMAEKLNINTLSSINVHEIFGNGDNRGARIMLS